jgi:hypothetical protein
MIHSDVRFSELLKKWLQGNFSSKDEKELQSMQKNDDFQREAMEGYQTFPEVEHEARLKALQLQLQQKSIKAPESIMSLYRKLSVAAVFALMVAAFWFIPRISDKKQYEVAQNLPLLKEKTNIPDPFIEEKSTPKSNDLPIPISKEDANLKANIKREENTSVAIQSAPTSTKNNINQTADLEKSEEIAAVQPTNMDISEVNLVTSEESAKSQTPEIPLPKYSNSPNPSKAEAASGDDKIAKSTVKKKQKSTGIPIPPRPVNEDLQPHNTDSKPNMDALKDKAEEVPAYSEPAGGWDAFQEYCRSNARLTDLARNNNVSGTVRLQFSITTNGDPINFLTIKSLGYGCDEEAIRLVKDFEWVKGKTNLVNVEIKFSR